MDREPTELAKRICDIVGWEYPSHGQRRIDAAIAEGIANKCFLLEDDPPEQHGQPIACTQCWNALSELHRKAETALAASNAECERLRKTSLNIDMLVESFNRDVAFEYEKSKMNVRNLEADNAALRQQVEGLRKAIADDSLAITFQTLGQYRTELLKLIGP